MDLYFIDNSHSYDCSPTKTAMHLDDSVAKYSINRSPDPPRDRRFRMSVRKKKVTRFECMGESFYWRFDNWHLRIYSEDKTFVVAYYMGHSGSDHLEVIGKRFPGVDRKLPRPVRLEIPAHVLEQGDSAGALVNALIRWCLDENHQLIQYVPKGET